MRHRPQVHRLACGSHGDRSRHRRGGSKAQTKTTTITIESWRSDDASIWTARSSRRSRRRTLTSRSSSPRPPRPSTTQRCQGPAQGRHRRRPHHLPAVRRVAGAVPAGPPGLAERPPGHRQLRLAWRSRPGSPTTARRVLRADGVGHPRLHLQQGHLRQARHQACRRPRTSSTPTWRRSRRTAPTSRSRWAPTTSGKPRRWASRTSARTTGMARRAVWRSINGKPKFTDEAVRGDFADLAKWSPTCRRAFAAQSTPTRRTCSPRPGRDLSGRLVGDRAASTRRRSSRWAPSSRRCRRRHTCYISDQTDIAHGPERAQQAHAEAQDVPRVGRLAGVRELYRNALPGFFSLATKPVDAERPARQGVPVLAQDVQVDDPPSYQILSRGNPNLENELWHVGRRHQRHHDPAGRRDAAPEGSRQVVSPEDEVTSWI